ncbi:hypothetical protein OEA41_009463 [Lepraria neglecta]|uniref:Uncharacterized protein n=1 Tax=Lepraria neglecta TaxID=209136 RepID=A0AAD9Z5W5_9LECA|nr:hypothetical protein OEA41_009463 [Lepraria neglecta]
MDRDDGKDPFAYHTYYAKNGLTIATMIEFRAFCADFFERHVRLTKRRLSPRDNTSGKPSETYNSFRKPIIAGQQAVITSLQDLSARQEAFIRDLNEQFTALQAINHEQQKLLSHFRDYVEGDNFLGDGLKEDKNLGDLLDGLLKLQGEGAEAGIDSVP